MNFKDKKLGKIVNDDNLMYRKFGRKRTHKLKLRLSELLNAVTLEDVRHLPGHYQELNNDRKGQWACDLDNNYKLIFQPIENPVPEDNVGKFIWSEIKAITIVEIIKHHKGQ
jgi:toxin HigB-1